MYRLEHIYIESTSSVTGIHGNTTSGSKFLATTPTNSDQDSGPTRKRTRSSVETA